MHHLLLRRKSVGFASLELTMGTGEPRKTLFSLTPPQKAVLAIAVVVGCFAIVYPKVVHPTICYMLGWSKPPSKVDSIPPPNERGKFPHIHRGRDKSDFRAQPGPMPPHMGDHMQARGREKSFWYSLLPFYTIGVIAFLIYTLSKMLRTSDSINERSGRNWRKRNGAPPFGLRDLSDAQLKNLHQRLLETETTMQTILKCLETNGDTKTELKEDIQDTLQNLEKLTATATRHVLNSEENCNDEYCSDNEEMLVLKDLEKALAQFESFSTDYLKMQNSKNFAAVKNQESEAFEKCSDESDNFRNTEIGVTDESKKELQHMIGNTLEAPPQFAFKVFALAAADCAGATVVKVESYSTAKANLRSGSTVETCTQVDLYVLLSTGHSIANIYLQTDFTEMSSEKNGYFFNSYGTPENFDFFELGMKSEDWQKGTSSEKSIWRELREAHLRNLMISGQINPDARWANRIANASSSVDSRAESIFPKKGGFLSDDSKLHSTLQDVTQSDEGSSSYLNSTTDLYGSVQEDVLPTQAVSSGCTACTSPPVQCTQIDQRLDNVESGEIQSPSVDHHRPTVARSVVGLQSDIETEVGCNLSLSDWSMGNSGSTSARRFSLKTKWDPTQLLRQLYQIRCPDLESKLNHKAQSNMVGYLDHLPLGMRPDHAPDHAWQRRYMRTEQGLLLWYKTAEVSSTPVGQITIAGSLITRDDEKLLIIIENNATLLTLRCRKFALDRWYEVLRAHAELPSNMCRRKFLQPTLPQFGSRDENKVCVIEIGTCSTRAGLVERASYSYPHLFFPSVVSNCKERLVGEDAIVKAALNNNCNLQYVWSWSSDFRSNAVNVDAVKRIFEWIIEKLSIKAVEYQFLLTVPSRIPEAALIEMVRILLFDFDAAAVSVARQGSLAMIAFNTFTGVFVDIGEKLTIAPFVDSEYSKKLAYLSPHVLLINCLLHLWSGFIVSNAVITLPCFGSEIAPILKNEIIKNNPSFTFDSLQEGLLVRYLKETQCFVLTDDRQQQANDKRPLVSLKQCDPDRVLACRKLQMGNERFESAEMLFHPKRWGMDVKGLPKLIFQSIQSCAIDNRRSLYENIFLVGGTSLLPGLQERIELELGRLVPKSVKVEVHAAPFRYHASFIGAKILADSSAIEQFTIKKDSFEKFALTASEFDSHL
ncbi:actin [Trichinella patagoniensis]|uniref:Actin n=1 Tax=Trichinella patagoniensis TaxID=990121 RepID=A0A0V1ABD2_9BILA|nr:actin [Trichinella patagoniensis]